MNIILAGSSGYIGGRLKKELLKKPEILDETINMIFVKNSSILEKNNLI